MGTAYRFRRTIAALSPAGPRNRLAVPIFGVEMASGTFHRRLPDLVGQAFSPASTFWACTLKKEALVWQAWIGRNALPSRAFSAKVSGAWVFRDTRLPVATVIENLEDFECRRSDGTVRRNAGADCCGG